MRQWVAQDVDSDNKHSLADSYMYNRAVSREGLDFLDGGSFPNGVDVDLSAEISADIRVLEYPYADVKDELLVYIDYTVGDNGLETPASNDGFISRAELKAAAPYLFPEDKLGDEHYLRYEFF